MTTTTPTRTAGDGPGSSSDSSDNPGVSRPKAPRRPRGRRWLRLVVPPVAAILVLLVGAVLYRLEQPGRTDADYLSPESHAAIGAADLAGRVRAAGVTIIPEHHSSDALVAAYSGDATLLITTPELMHRYYLRMLKLLPASTRVVVVEPGTSTIADGQLPFGAARRNYSAKVAAPGCDYAPAARAGQAAVVRTRYGPVLSGLGEEISRCYDDSLVVYRREAVTVTVVGSADPFRNDRIGEHGNAELATALLTGAPRLIWLDLHRREPPPLVTDDPGLKGAPAAPPSLRPIQPGEPENTDFPVEGKSPPPRPVPPAAGGDPGNAQPPQDPPNPLWVAFPKWVYPTVALLVLGVAMLAVARARRLGGPVVEPLPVVVRSSETASGRGRLYQRARARPEALQVLRDAALARLARRLRLDPDVEHTALIEAVAASSGWPPATVGHVLFGPAPTNDAELVAAAAHLEQLVDAATTQPSAPDATSQTSAATTQPPAPDATSEAGATTTRPPAPDAASEAGATTTQPPAPDAVSEAASEGEPR
ncbi:DUF4350 domain-containing protein [Dactylosporangium sp. NPDC048998]|uniref:DUF4350 domain-containing protein n=1 Tax=Dactylosporangium sp. NPDC048998 TaxID=3363976 RepID=UPI0037138188